MTKEEIYLDLSKLSDKQRKDVENAQKYLQECGRDMGFMGSPEYDRQKKIVDAYFEPIRQKGKEDTEKAEYLKLKSKYEDS